MPQPVPARPTSTRTKAMRTAAAACAGLALVLSGCTYHETNAPYQPAAGTQTEASGIKVRNLMFITDGDDAGTLAGSLLASADDELTKVEGHSLKADNSPDKALALEAKPVELKAAQLVNLADLKVSTKDLTPGGMTQLTLTFAKGAPITMMVPVVDAKAQSIPVESGSAAKNK